MDYPCIQYEPYGVVLIMGAWNYPVQLLLSPLVGAVSAGMYINHMYHNYLYSFLKLCSVSGNCAVIKPSEVSQNTERTIKKLLPSYLDPVYTSR